MPIIETTNRTVRKLLNEANPNKLEVGWSRLPAGEALALLPRKVRAAVVANELVLPEDAKAAALLDVYVVTGAVTGRFTPVAAEAVPATTEAAPNSAGNIAFLPADAVTFAEVVYVAHEGPVCEDEVDVDAGGTEQGALLAGNGAAVLLEVEALAGGATGVFAPVPRGTTPGAGEAAIADDPTLVEFAAADAVTRARIRYVAQPGMGAAPQAVSGALDADPLT